ncbi:hypothetical protein pb186bvf_009926 [Paramecium bursaria]
MNNDISTSPLASMVLIIMKYLTIRASKTLNEVSLILFSVANSVSSCKIFDQLLHTYQMVDTIYL